MRMTISLVTISLLISLGTSSAIAADIEKGKSRSSICAACHGVTGISKQDFWPNLAGQKSDYVAAELKEYRAGTRKDTVMEAVAKLLTDDEVTNLAAYFAQQRPAEPQVLEKSTADVTHERREVD